MSSAPAPYILPGLTDFPSRPHEFAQQFKQVVLDAAATHSLYGIDIVTDFFTISDADFIAAWQVTHPGAPVPPNLHITRSLPAFITPDEMLNMPAQQQRVATASNEMRQQNLTHITNLTNGMIAGIGENHAQTIAEPVTRFRNMSAYTILNSVMTKFNKPAMAVLHAFKTKMLAWNLSKSYDENISAFIHDLGYMQQNDFFKSRGDAIDALWIFMASGTDTSRSISHDWQKAHTTNDWADDATVTLGFTLKPFFTFFDNQAPIYAPTVGQAGFSAHTAAATAVLDAEVGAMQHQIALLVKAISDLTASGGTPGAKSGGGRKPSGAPDRSTWAKQPSNIKNLPARFYCPIHGYEDPQGRGHWGWQCDVAHANPKFTNAMKHLLNDSNNTLKFSDGTAFVPSVKNK
jgi:hypothetical protein